LRPYSAFRIPHSALDMNITLRDLVRWPESPLRAVGSEATPAQRRRRAAVAVAEAGLRSPDREVSWPVTMRATPPMLPHVDEGALVLLPAATLAEVRPSLPGALRELRRRGVAALVLDAGGGAYGDLPLRDTDGLDLLRLKEPEGRVGPELEAALARLLNGRRAQLYRRGTEIDRALTEATLRGQGVA